MNGNDRKDSEPAADLTRRSLLALVGAGAVTLAGCERTSIGAVVQKSSAALVTNPVQVCETVVGLRNSSVVAPPSTGTALAIALGYATPGDGGGGLFEWDASDARDDGGLFFAPAGGTGHWARLHDSVINIAWYGPTSTTDLSALIQKANDALGAAPGGIVVPPGNYTFATSFTLSNNRALHLGAGHYACTITTPVTPIVVPGDNVTISGDGWNTEIEPPFSWGFLVSAQDMVNGSGRGMVNLVVRDLHFVSGPSGMPVNQFSAGGTINLMNGTNCRVERCHFDNVTSYGVDIGGGDVYLNHADGCWVVDCLFDGVLSANIAYVNGQNVVIKGNVFRNPGRGIQSTPCIDLEENDPNKDLLRNWTISDNVFDLRKTNQLIAPTSGIFVQGSTSGNGTISGNTFIGSDNVPDYSTVSCGVLLNAAQNVIIAGNNFKGIFYNGAIEVYGGSTRCSIVANRFSDGGDAPSPFGSGRVVVSLNDSTFLTVNGNSFYSVVQGYNAVVELGNSDNNHYWGNYFEQSQENFSDPAYNPRIVLLGANSRAHGNVFAGRRVDGTPPRRSRRRVNANAAVKDTDDIIGVDTSAGTIALSLPDPAAATVGTDGAALAFLVQIEVAGHNVVLHRHGNENINGIASDYVFSTGRVTIYSDGIDWYAA
jgi:hypothetical protein